ncbi:MAG: M16 family metallopeptidase [Thermoanaerobaculia bacterium]
MIQKFVLSNNVTVLIDEMRDVRSLALGFFCKTGSADEPDSKRGLSHFLEHLLFKRTKHRSPLAIARAIDRLGGDVDAFTTKEYTAFYAHTLDSKFSEALDLLGDVVLSPAFDSEDIERERGVILEEIGECNDMPDDLVHELFVRSFWRNHPLGKPILGTVESVRRISKVDISSFYRERYGAHNLVVSMAGHVRAARVLPSIEKLFSRRPAGEIFPISGRRPKPFQHFSVERRTGLEQAHVCLGMSGPSQGSSRRYAAHLLDIVLGGGMSSRLFQEVREKRGLVYSIGSSLNSYRLGGYETIQASCAPKNLRRVIDTTLSVLRKIRRDGVQPREVVRAKEFLKGNLMLALESTVSRMSAQARRELYFGRVEAPEEWLAKVESVTQDEIESVTAEICSGESLSLSIVGDVRNLRYSGSDLSAAVA